MERLAVNVKPWSV